MTLKDLELLYGIEDEITEKEIRQKVKEDIKADIIKVCRENRKQHETEELMESLMLDRIGNLPKNMEDMSIFIKIWILKGERAGRNRALMKWAGIKEEELNGNDM